MDGQSQSITEEQKKKLKDLFPEAFSEDKVDWGKLKSALGREVDLGERYGLSWKGKSNVFRAIQETTTKTLKPVREESVNFDETENLFIEGDNLEVLKILQRAYYGKVKMIYIDPPYNTGNDFVYNDKFAQTQAEYEEEAGIRDEEGKVTRTDGLKKNSRDGGHFHSNWLNMIYPRLYLARNLLKQDGVIFVSIDDNEVHNLRMIMNEIFGEESFIEQIVWKNKYGSGAMTKGFASVHEYVLCYSRGPLNNVEAPMSEEQIKAYKNKDEKFETRGGFITQPLGTTTRDNRKNLQYTIHHSGIEIKPEKQWIWSEDRFLGAYKNNEIVINERDGKYSVRFKQYLKNEKGVIRNSKPVSILNGPFNQEGTSELRDLLGAGIFPFPKPSRLIKYFASFVLNEDDDKDGIFLDLFAGSGTTAHAVDELNAKDGGNRKWIMVQIPEEVEEKSEAYTAGYKNIADIAKERIRRAAKKIKERNKDAKFDDGFKVLKLEDTNFKAWDRSVTDPEKLKEQMRLHVDSVKDGVSEEHLLAELTLKVGIEPTVKHAKKSDYWLVGDDLVVCLADSVTEGLFKKILAEKPAKVILLDRALHNNDQLKANLLLQAEKSNIEVLVV